MSMSSATALKKKANRIQIAKRVNGTVTPLGGQQLYTKKRSGSIGSWQGSVSAFGLLEKSKKSWIASHFARRECIRYVEKPNSNKDGNPVCQCGRKKSKHTQSALNTDPSVTDWTPERCTKQLPTNAYGEIDFQGTGTQKRAPYIRVSHDTDAKKLLDLMLGKWDLEVPNLVISVTGGAKSFVLKPRLKEVFRRGLVKAAKTTGAWIITGGTNTGVMKHVGEAVKEQQLMLGVDTEVNVVGIASWGIVDKQKALIQAKGESGRYPAIYNMEPTQGWNGALLDSNHSHFILVDNGTKGKYGVEISLRSHIEEAIMKLHTDSRSKSGSIGVPVVLLVLEGGPNTVQTMYELIKKKVPAVVIEGSGRAADVVAFAYSHTIKKCVDGQTISVIDPAYEDQVKEKVTEVFSFLGESGVNNLYEKIKAVLEDEKMVSVYRLDDGTISQEIDLAILKALLKANRSSPLAQLNLALAWNRIDLAKSDIFTGEKLWTTEQLSGPMLTALLDDKADFVELFLGNGLSMSEFLSTEILCQLYAGVPSNSTIKPLLQEEMNERQATIINMQIVGELIEGLMGDMYRSQYLRDGRYFSDPPPAPDNDGGMRLKKMLSKSTILVPDINRIDPIPTPYRDVFLWSVLCNRRELARVLWEAGRQPVAAALMASRLLRSMADKSHTDDTITDISKDLKEHAKLFEERAAGVLDECFEENETLSQTLLVRELDDYGYLTCLDLAVSGDSQDFIAHTACQLLLTRLWMGAMAMNTTTFRVLLCMFVPFLIFPIIYFVPDVHQERQEAAREHEKSLDTKTAPVTPTYKTKKEENDVANNYDEESLVGVEEEEEVFSIEEYIPELRQDNSVEVMLRSKKLGVCQRIYAFYSAPFTKFVGNVISYVAFIVLYAYVIMMNFPRFDSKKRLGGISPVEILLYFWVFSILIEEIRQLASKAPKHFFDKVSIYFSDPWNSIDILSILAFVVAIILRCLPHEETFNAARVILSLDIVIFIVRSLQIFAVNRHLGPRLVMIRKMMDDLKQFVIILLVFLIAYGISLEAVMFPGPGQFARNNTLKSILGVLELPYWQMYGELFLDEIKGEKPGEFGAVSPIGQTLSPLLLAAYMLFANVLLLNLLIAIFSYTFELIQEDSDKVWKFQRYDLVLEYHNRPMFSPPLILIGHLFVFIRWVWQLCRCGNPPPVGSSMKLKLNDVEMEQINNWEFQAAETYSFQKMAENSDQLHERVKALGDRVMMMSNTLDRLVDTALDPSRSIKPSNEDQSAALDQMTDGRLGRMEVAIEANTEMLNKILELLKSGQLQGISPSSTSESGPPVITFLHHKARSSPYPQSTVKRTEVPDDKVSWDVSFPDYVPVEYTAQVVLSKPPWADPDLMSMAVHARPALKYNQLDQVYNVDRTSYSGVYKVEEGLPLNPMGRTGMKGRGLLGRFGPNHAADPIVTRWKRTSAGVMLEGGKKVLEFVAIMRKDNNQWAIPGGMVEPGQVVTQALKAEFGEEALAKMNVSPEERERISKQIERLFQHGEEVYKGYVDDPRNTDNSWMETLAVNFHDEKGDMFSEFQLQAGDDAAAVRWQRVSGNIPLYASHVAILEKVAKMRDAAF